MPLLHALKKTSGLKRASQILNKKQKETETVEKYVKNQKDSLALQLKIREQKLAILDELQPLSEEEKIDHLFTLLDVDYSGNISAIELSDALRKVSNDMSFQQGITNAVQDVARNDTKHDGVLDRNEFRRYIMAMASRLEGSPSITDLCEYMITEVMFSSHGNTLEEKKELYKNDKKIRNTAEKLGMYYSAMDDPNMKELFNLFDSDHDGTIKFTEVAVGLYKIHRDMKKATDTASDLMDVLLLVDKSDDKRTLNYCQFVRLILNVCAIDDKLFHEISEQLIVNMHTKIRPTLEESSELLLAEKEYEEHRELVSRGAIQRGLWDTLAYSKTSKLFDLWDKNKDGFISKEELVRGVRGFYRFARKNTTSILETMEQANNYMLKFDGDKDQKLNKEEFALFIVKLAKEEKGITHYELIDFLAVTSLLKEKSPEKVKYIKSITQLRGKESQEVSNDSNKKYGELDPSIGHWT